MAGVHGDPLTEIPPPSRFDPDDLQHECDQVTSPPPPPFIVWSRDLKSQPLQPQMLLVCLSRPSCTLMQHIPGKKLIASIILPEISMAKNTVHPSAEDQTCCIYSLSGDLSIIAVCVQYKVPNESSHGWVRTLFSAIRPESTLVLELLQSDHFRSKLSSDEPMLFVLESDKLQQEVPEEPIKNRHEIPYLPSGSLIDGAGAAVLSYCQMRELRCRMLLSWPEQEIRKLGSTAQKFLEYLPGAQTLGFAQASKASVGKRGISSYELFM